jgi:hypothetical protein
VIRQQAADLGVDRVAELGGGDHTGSPDDVPEVLVPGDLVLDPDRLGGHPALAVDGVRVGGEPGPEHDTVVLRITGGDAESERVAAAGRRGVRGRGVPGPGAEQYGGRARTTQAEEATA